MNMGNPAGTGAEREPAAVRRHRTGDANTRGELRMAVRIATADSYRNGGGWLCGAVPVAEDSRRQQGEEGIAQAYRKTVFTQDVRSA